MASTNVAKLRPASVHRKKLSSRKSANAVPLHMLLLKLKLRSMPKRWVFLSLLISHPLPILIHLFLEVQVRSKTRTQMMSIRT